MVKNKLFKRLKQRAIEVKEMNENKNTRLYACYLPIEKDKINELESYGFLHDEGMHV